MPIIKSAKKKLRKDRSKTLINLEYIKSYKLAIQAVKKGAEDKRDLISKAYSKIDKSAKRGVIHKNKANRLKSRINKLLKLSPRLLVPIKSESANRAK